MSLMSRSREMAEKRKKRKGSRTKTSADSIVKKRQAQGRKAKGASDYGGTPKAQAGTLPGGKRPRSAEWKADANPTGMSNKAGSGGSQMPGMPRTTVSGAAAKRPKNNPMGTIGRPARNPKRGRPLDAMKAAAKNKKFDFGRAIRRGFGQLA